jgi:hypothetical protein
MLPSYNRISDLIQLNDQLRRTGAVSACSCIKYLVDTALICVIVNYKAMEQNMEKTYNIVLTKAELETVAKIVRRSIGNTGDIKRRQMLGRVYDELTATLDMEMIDVAQKNLDNLTKVLHDTKKAEQRKHLQVIK